ncbi:Cytoplasmic Zn-finger protein BRAP2 (BRCA1 associated protein) [Phaffia rhodozyma]|uniref:Cytoplasmic Zn-finger protein BRAP2 (BRCA1 associated protein) n=1 Tax=Phaffia rhodozyma TaxID=264483 RepID=A0A0F7SSY1_PHARH|nr:Cytoplasmic Zn-finger protein BRAP2 (BRCA1 associated protein) [Phaffia rhodozyma]
MDKALSLPTAQDFQPTPSPRPPPPLYSIALSLSSEGSSTADHHHPPPSIVASPRELALAFKHNETPPAGLTVDENREGVAQRSTGRVAGPITLEWVDFPSSSVEGSIDASSAQPIASQSGTLNLPLGVVHLYRHSSSTKPGDGQSAERPNLPLACSSSAHVTAEVKSASKEQIAQTAHDTTLVAILAIPSYMTPSDFLAYVGQVEEEMECLRMIRDVSPARSLGLIKFRSQQASEEFIEEYNGKPFNSLEPETCHVVPILNVLTHYVQPTSAVQTNSASSDANSASDDLKAVPTAAFPIMLESERPSISLTDPLLKDTYELPTCAVCLERMDSAVTGLITVPCSHSFHCACLSKWADSRCPIKSPSVGHRKRRITSVILLVMRDEGKSVDLSDLWFGWLWEIFGWEACPEALRSYRTYVFSGVGDPAGMELCCRSFLHPAVPRERKGFIIFSFASTSLLTRLKRERKQDEYVHRLIQNKSTGGLVELPASSSSSNAQPTTYHPSSSLPIEKLEAISLEYSHLLSSQLTAQREYFHSHQESLEDRISQLEVLLSQSERGKEKEKIKRLERDLQAEKEMSRALQENLYVAKGKAELLKGEIELWKEKVQEGEEQVRDLMFFLEARDKIAAAEGESVGQSATTLTTTTETAQSDPPSQSTPSLLGEMRGGTVVLPPSQPSSSPSPGKPSGKKKSKKSKR